MALETSVQLVAELQRLEEDGCDEEGEVERQQRFHLRLAHRTDYWPFLQHSLRQALHATQVELLLCAQYLAYLTNFHSQHDLHHERTRYLQALTSGLFVCEGARQVYAMLAEDECLLLLEEVKQRIQDITSVSYLRDVALMLDILGKKLSWEIKKRTISRSHPHSYLQLFVDQLLAFLCSKQYAQNEELLLEIARLVTLALSYLRQEAHGYKTMLLGLMQHWLCLKMFKKEVKVEVMKALSSSLQWLGLFKPELFYQFFSVHMGLLEEVEYLQLLSTFLGKLSKNQRFNQSEISKLLKSLFCSVLRVPSGAAAFIYRSKALLIDQIIKISTLFSCDLSKHLSQYFQQARTASHEALMGALMLVFDQRMSAETMRAIEPHKLKYLEGSKQSHLYEDVLRHYCEKELEFEEFIVNPELADDFMWEFLLLRTTVTINYNALCQLDRVCCLFINLLKFVLLDIFPQQCLEIIEKLLENDTVYSLKELEGTSFFDILQAVRPTLLKQVENQLTKDDQKFSALFANLLKVLEMIGKKHQIKELRGFKLFVNVIMLSNSLPERFVTSSFIKHQNQLLQAVMPMDFEEVTGQELRQSLEELLLHLRNYKNIGDFALYLQAMSRAVQHPHLHEIFLTLNNEIISFLQGRQMPENLLDSYKINYFMLARLSLQEQVLDNCWSMLLKLPSFHYPQFYFHILALFRYFARWVNEQCPQDEADFLRYQLEKAEKVAGHLEAVIEEAEVLQQIQELLSFKQALLLFLQETLLRYSSLGCTPCMQLSLVHSYILRGYLQMKNNRELISTFQERTGIRQFWCNCQLLILLMTASMKEEEKWTSSHQLIGTLLDIDDKFEWISKLYPKQYEKQLQQFALCLNCQLYQLQETARRRLTASYNN